MTDKPILFSAPMVQAILAGRKTMTRRALKPQPTAPFDAIFYDDDVGFETGDALTGDRYQMMPVKYKIGDRLYVKEAAWMWCERRTNGTTKTGRQKWRYVPLQSAPVVYLATDGTKKPIAELPHPETGNQWGWRYKVGRFMPRWASRITLEVTGVKVERLNSISEEDALAEGAWHWNETHDVARVNDNAREAFCHLWESINGEDSWSANPWVVAYSFKRVKP